MQPTTRSSESNDSYELAAAECLDMLEGEREISMGLIEESERLLTGVVRELDALPDGERTWPQRSRLARSRAHLTALRSFLGGGFTLDTKES